ncbi:hypothetical protein JOE23_003451 [Amphibacillus cookii]|nr:hypothetical protein [Amphibacillus cookii]
MATIYGVTSFFVLVLAEPENSDEKVELLKITHKTE